MIYDFHTLLSCCSVPLVPKAWIFTANPNFHSKPQQGGPGNRRALRAGSLRLPITSEGADGSECVAKQEEAAPVGIQAQDESLQRLGMPGTPGNAGLECSL